MRTAFSTTRFEVPFFLPTPQGRTETAKLINQQPPVVKKIGMASRYLGDDQLREGEQSGDHSAISRSKGGSSSGLIYEKGRSSAHQLDPLSTVESSNFDMSYEIEKHINVQVKDPLVHE